MFYVEHVTPFCLDYSGDVAVRLLVILFPFSRDDVCLFHNCFVLTNKNAALRAVKAQSVMLNASGVFPLSDAVAAMLVCNGHKISSRLD